MNPIGNRTPSNPPPINRLGTEDKTTMSPHSMWRRGTIHNPSAPTKMSVPEIRPTATNTAGANTASFGMYAPQGRWPGPQARRPGITKLRERASSDEIAESGSPPHALSPGTYWNLSAFADEIEDKASFPLSPGISR